MPHPDFQASARPLSGVPLQRMAVALVAHEVWLGLPLSGVLTLAEYLPEPLIWLCMGLLGLLSVVRWALLGRLTRVAPLFLPMMALLLLLPLSWMASIDHHLSLVRSAQLVAQVALALALTNWARSPERVRLLCGLLLVGTIALVLGGPFLVNWKDERLGLFQPYLVRVTALLPLPTLLNPNLLASVLAAVVPLPLALLLWGQSGWLTEGAVPPFWTPRTARLFLTGLVSMVLLLILATASRGAWLAVAAGVALLGVWRWPVLAWLLGPGAGLAVVLARGQVITSVETWASSGGVGDPSGLASRLEIWNRAIYMLQDFSFTGIGIGTFQLVGPLLYPFFNAPTETPPLHAHNIFLQAGVDLGVGGMVALIALFVVALLLAWKAAQQFNRRGAPALAAVARGLWMSVLVISLHGLVEGAMWGGQPAIIAWYLFGLIGALALVAGLERDQRSA